jgi:hypothetical protein
MAAWAVVVPGLLFAISPAAGAPSVRTANCVAQGARHVDGKRVTTTYWVDLGGVTCAFAKPWVAKLTHTRPAKYDAEGKLTGGPRGWTCGSGRGYPALAFKGGCCKGPPECRSGSSTYFSWKPRYHDDNPARRAYTYDLEIVGSGTVTFPEASGGGTVTSHWTQTVRGLRISAVRRTSWLPPKYRKAGWELFFINGKASGTATATADYSKPPDGCSAHESGQFTVRAQVGNDGVGASAVSLGVDGEPLCVQGPLDAFGGILDGQGFCSGLAGLCWEFTPYSGNFRFANNHKPPRPWLPPMGQIVNGLSWSKTVHFDLTDLGGVHTATVRITLTRRKG